MSAIAPAQTTTNVPRMVGSRRMFDRALTLYSDGRTAVRSQVWMLLIMIGFTTLALWLLKSANA